MFLGPANGFASGSISLLMLSSSLKSSSATELVGDEEEDDEDDKDEEDDPKAVNTVLVEGGAAVVTSSSSSSCLVSTSTFFPPLSFLLASSALVKEIGGLGNPSPGRTPPKGLRLLGLNLEAIFGLFSPSSSSVSCVGAVVVATSSLSVLLSVVVVVVDTVCPTMLEIFPNLFLPDPIPPAGFRRLNSRFDFTRGPLRVT